MLFMVMHKHDKSTENDVRPTPAFIAAMGELIGGLAQKGILKDGAGLGKSATRTRVTFKDGACSVTHGPYTGTANELPAMFMQLTVKSKDEAVGWATRLGRVLGDGQIELGKTTEAWDLGLEPEPLNPPLHYLLLLMATPASEAGQPLSASADAALSALKKEMTDAGVLTSAGRLQPSASATRLRMAGGKRQVIDGPFSESKELIGGFALLDMPSKEDVIAFAWRYGELMLTSVETLEMDVRPVLA